MRKHLTIEDRRLSYLERDGRGARRTLVLLHAFPLNADMWAPQLDAAPPGWRLIAPDFRGFGESDPDRGDLASARLSLDDYAGDVFDMLDRLEVRAAALAGLSLGGYVIFAMLRAARQLRIEGLILADTRPQADTEEGRAGRLRMVDLVDRHGVSAACDEMLPKLVAPKTRDSDPDTVKRVRQLMLAAPATAVKGALYRIMTRPDSTRQLEEIKCPTLVIVGEQDSLTPPDLSRDMQSKIAGATLQMIAAAGHLSNLEQPAAFNAACTRFLSRL